MSREQLIDKIHLVLRENGSVYYRRKKENSEEAMFEGEVPVGKIVDVILSNLGIPGPDYKGFTHEIIDGNKNRWFNDTSGDVIQDAAVNYGIVKEVKYDPDIHGPNNVDAEPGDAWFVFVDEETK